MGHNPIVKIFIYLFIFHLNTFTCSFIVAGYALVLIRATEI